LAALSTFSPIANFAIENSSWLPLSRWPVAADLDGGSMSGPPRKGCDAGHVRYTFGETRHARA